MKVIAPVLLSAFLAIPAAAGVLEISIDVENGVAWVPAGTVIPPGMTIHAGLASRVELTDEPMIGTRSRVFRAPRRAHSVKSAPLRIEFGDDARFAGLRAHFGAELAEKKEWFRARENSQACFDTYYQATVDTWYTGYFKSTFCRDNPGPGVGNYGTWSFGSQAWGGGDAEAYVSDDNNNYNCSQLVIGYGSASCSDSAYTQLWSSGCLNTVVTGGTTTFWEYISEYEIQYHIVSAWIDYCTYFY